MDNTAGNTKTTGPARPKHTEMLVAMQDMQDAIDRLERIIKKLLSEEKETLSEDRAIPSFEHVPLAQASSLMIDRLNHASARIDTFADILNNDLLY